ncbi:uncharacterized protein [Leuresthes tenuis]|uniref:uncharacterized protein isoform X1 n=1 Tax=Leuresthes tenuis TaxID=355514 RepID=UPI003B509CB1
MAALTSLSVALLSVGLLLSVSAEQRIVKAGEDVILPCGVPNNNKNIIVVEWSRTDLGEEYVFVFRDRQLYLEGQHPSYQNRVDLQDRQMKDGNVSLILKDVTTDDGGTYECRVVQRGEKELKTISTFILSVSPSGNQDGRREDGGEEGGEKGLSVGAMVGLIVALSAVISLVAVAVLWIYKRKPACLKSYQPPAEPAAAERKRNITAEAGEDVTLRCRVPDNNNIIAVEWRRTDLKPEYVLLYRDDQLFLEGQHPSFKDRVDLQDRQMKDGNVSLILKDVTTDDGGTYECRVVQRETDQAGNELKTISIIILSVPPPEQRNITAEPGQDVILPCRVPKFNISQEVLQWFRTDPFTFLVYGYQTSDPLAPLNRNPSLKNRVNLQDRQMKDGDLSLILRNVTAADSGTYKCRVYDGDIWCNRAINGHRPISIISLEVPPPGNQDGGGKDGGEKDGGEKDGGGKEGGEKDGGEKEGGEKDGGGKDGGIEYRGNEEEGNKNEGNKDGGIEYRGNEEEGIEYRGNEEEGIEYRGNEEEGIEYRGNEEEGIEYRGNEEEGIEYRGNEEEGIEHRLLNDEGNQAAGHMDSQLQHLGSRGGSVGLIVSVVVVVLLLVIIDVFVIYKRLACLRQRSLQHSAVQHQMLI